jgi:hypothetical protein
MSDLSRRRDKRFIARVPAVTLEKVGRIAANMGRGGPGLTHISLADVLIDLVEKAERHLPRESPPGQRCPKCKRDAPLVGASYYCRACMAYVEDGALYRDMESLKIAHLKRAE